MIKTELQNLCLEYIIAEWKQLQPLPIQDHPVAPPWGVWIRLYEPIAIDWNDLSDRKNTIIKVWFLTERGIEERNPWEYARFITVNGFRSWSIMEHKPHEAVWGDKFHEIGLAAFAEILETDKVYLDIQWGQRWGKGYHMKVNGQEILEIDKRVWIG